MPVLVFDGETIRPLGGGAVWARWSGANLLAGEVRSEGDARLALWSGWYGDAGDPPSHDGTSSAPDPRTWSPAGWSAMQRGLTTLAAQHAPGLLVRTHHAHVVSDAPSCLRMLRASERERERIQLLVDVGAMIAPSMWSAAEDHAARILGALAAEDGVAAVVASAPGKGLPGPLGARPLAGETMARLIERLVPPRVPLVFIGAGPQGTEVGPQLALLAGLPHVS